MMDGENNKGALVAIRIRPLIQQEIERGCDKCIEVEPGEPQVQIKNLAFTYKYIFPKHIQQKFHDTAVRGLIGKLFQGVTELPVTSTMEMMMVLERGSFGQVTRSTTMNQALSRNHAVFTIVITKKSCTDRNIARTSKFHMMDLAGSERIKKTKPSGKRLKGGVKINQRLLVLALGDGTSRTYNSYRDIIQGCCKDHGLHFGKQLRAIDLRHL